MKKQIDLFIFNIFNYLIEVVHSTPTTTKYIILKLFIVERKKNRKRKKIKKKKMRAPT